MRIAVVGGSIGGLTAGCLLRDAGHDVTVYERSSTELEERGAGIGLLRAASRYLVERAGVDIDAVSVCTEFIRYLGRANGVLHQQAHPYRFSSWNTVYRRMLAAYGPRRYALGHDLQDWIANPDCVKLAFANGEQVDADLVVCADGIGSICRTRLLPEARPGYAGYVAWRGVVPEAELPGALSRRLAEAITYHVRANSHILVYPIPALNGSVRPGERLINFVWYRNYLDGEELEDLLTDATGERRSLSVPPGTVARHHLDEARASAAARLPADLAAVVLAAEQLFIQVIYDLSIERMVFGRLCLLGDAAFVVRPHAAAGSAKAADDGWALSSALASTSDLAAGLAAWEARQLRVGSDLVARTRRIGRRSQVDNDWVPGDPELLFGLNAPGDA